LSQSRRPRRLASGRLASGLLAAPLLLAACAVGPTYRRPALSPAAGYGLDGKAAAMVAGTEVSAEWWRVFGSDALDALVAEALKNNSTVAAAKAALKAAREQVKAQRAAYVPAVTASLQPSRQQFAPTLSSPLQSGGDLYSLTTTQVSIAYAPDLFGANRRAVEALVAAADQQRFELEAVRLTLATNVVQAAVQDALLRAEIETTRAIVADQEATLASFRRQYDLGQASKADLAAQEALLAQARAALPPLQKQFEINRDLLAALVGRTPGEPVQAPFAFSALKSPDRVPLSLPADLVAHRPDVRMADAALHAASAQIGVAAAARWPSLQIDAGAGGAALGLTPKFNSASNFWSIAGTLTETVFDAGALRHKEKAAKALYDQAAAQYQGTVVAAFQNTADTLHALAADADALTLAEAAEAASGTSVAIARRQLALGDVSRLAVLNAEQTDAQAKIAVLQARANRYADVVALFQALGGGWWTAGAPVASMQPGATPKDLSARGGDDGW
jgi:NodT family efflux transporter outer membrane factor (OMF) lipoprotein